MADHSPQALAEHGHTRVSWEHLSSGAFTLAAPYILRVGPQHAELLDLQDGRSAHLNDDAAQCVGLALGKLARPAREGLLRRLQSPLLQRQAMSVIDDLAARQVLHRRDRRRATCRNAHLAWPTALFLRTLHLHHTSACNLNCSFCYAATEAKLPFSLWRDTVIEAVETMGTYVLAFSGGEPLLDPRLRNLLDALRRYRLSLCLFTNAVVLTEEMVSLLKSLPHLLVCASLHTVQQETFSRMARTSLPIETVLRNLERMTGEGLSVRVGSVFVRGLNDSPAQVDALFDTVSRLRPAGYAISSASPMGRAKGTIPRSFPQDYRCLLEKYVRRFLVPGGSAPRLDPRVSHPCLFATGTCNILPDGQVTPCVSMPDFKLGSIRRNSLLEVWNNCPDRFAELRASAWTSCAACRLAAFCRGGCRGRSYARMGVLGRCDPEARLAADITRRILTSESADTGRDGATAPARPAAE